MNVQSWIERFFDSQSDLQSPNNGETEPPQMTLASLRELPYTSDSHKLRNQVLMLRNEILYERFLRHQTEKMMQTTHMEKANCWDRDNINKSLQVRVMQQQNEIRGLKEDVERWQKQYHEVSDRMNSWDAKMQSRVDQMNETVQRLTEENLDLHEARDRLEFQIKDMRKQLDEKNGKIEELETKYMESSTKVDRLKKTEAKSQSLQEEMFMWERSHAKWTETTKQNRELADGIILRNQIIQHLNQKLDISNTHSRSLASQLNTSKAMLDSLHIDRRNQDERIRELQSVLKQQQAISDEKVDLLEQRYRTTKALNVILHVSALHLRKRCGMWSNRYIDTFHSSPSSS